MRRINPRYPIQILITLFWFTCLRTLAQPSSGNTTIRHIPPDADAVYHVDMGAIFSKTSLATLETSFHQFSPAGAAIDPFYAFLQQGVDLHSDLYVAVSNRYHPDSPVYTTAIYPLIDAAKFIAYMRSQITALRPADQHSQLQVMTSSSVAIAWDNRHAVIVTRERAHNAPQLYSIDVLRDLNYRRALTAWRGFPNSYFMTDPDFKKAFSEKADAHIWNRHGSGYAALGQALQWTPFGNHLDLLSRLIKATREHNIGILRFDTGRITYRRIRLTTPSETVSASRLVNPPLNPGLVAGAPFGNILGAAILHFEPAALLDTLSKLTAADKIRIKFTDGGLALRDISTALEGDCLLLAYEPSDDQQNPETLQMPDIFFVFTVKDTAAFIRLASFFKLTDAATATVVDTVFHTPFHYYALHNGIAVVTTTPQMAENYFNYSASASNPTARVLPKKMQEGSFSLGLDMGLVSDFLVSLTKGRGESTVEKARNLAAIYRKMGVFTVSSGELIGNGVVTDFEITLPDPNENGLAALLEIFRNLGKEQNVLH